MKKTNKDEKYLNEIKIDVVTPLKLGIHYATLKDKKLVEYISVYREYYRRYKLSIDLLSLDLIQSELEYRKTL